MDKFFKIKERGSNVKTEIIAGLTTFFAMAYIVVVNPNQIVGFSFDVPGVPQIWNAVYIASIIAAVIGTLLYALYAKLPFAQACGMGLNSFFFVSFILPALLNGESTIKGYQEGLFIILLSGVVFFTCSCCTGACTGFVSATGCAFGLDSGLEGTICTLGVGDGGVNGLIGRTGAGLWLLLLCPFPCA